MLAGQHRQATLLAEQAEAPVVAQFDLINASVQQADQRHNGRRITVRIELGASAISLQFAISVNTQNDLAIYAAQSQGKRVINTQARDDAAGHGRDNGRRRRDYILALGCCHR